MGQCIFSAENLRPQSRHRFAWPQGMNANVPSIVWQQIRHVFRCVSSSLLIDSSIDPSWWSLDVCPIVSEVAVRYWAVENVPSCNFSLHSFLRLAFSIFFVLDFLVKICTVPYTGARYRDYYRFSNKNHPIPFHFLAISVHLHYIVFHYFIS